MFMAPETQGATAEQVPASVLSADTARACQPGGVHDRSVIRLAECSNGRARSPTYVFTQDLDSLGETCVPTCSLEEERGECLSD